MLSTTGYIKGGFLCVQLFAYSSGLSCCSICLSCRPASMHILAPLVGLTQVSLMRKSYQANRLVSKHAVCSWLDMVPFSCEPNKARPFTGGGQLCCTHIGVKPREDSNTYSPNIWASVIPALLQCITTVLCSCTSLAEDSSAPDCTAELLRHGITLPGVCAGWHGQQ